MKRIHTDDPTYPSALLIVQNQGALTFGQNIYWAPENSISQVSAEALIAAARNEATSVEFPDEIEPVLGPRIIAGAVIIHVPNYRPASQTQHATPPIMVDPQPAIVLATPEQDAPHYTLPMLLCVPQLSVCYELAANTVPLDMAELLVILCSRGWPLITPLQDAWAHYEQPRQRLAYLLTDPTASEPWLQTGTMFAAHNSLLLLLRLL
jgi:hypothetical protein